MDLRTMFQITTSIDDLPRFASALSKDQSCALCKNGSHYSEVPLKKLKMSAKGSCQSCRLQYLGILQVFGPCHGRSIYLSSRKTTHIILLTKHYRSKEGTVYRDLGELWLYTKAGQPQCQWLPVCVGRDVPTRRSNYAPIVQDWLRTRQDTHSACKYKGIDASLPSRIIDVAHFGSDIVRLVEAAAEKGRYLALSHCWGGKVPIQTTRGNYTDMMRGIDFKVLSRTFQDAVSVTRDLGQRYLWIDALCIIQEDTRDWEQESGNMAAIYQNAYMVIGADMSADSHGGFLDSEGRYNNDGEHIAIIDSDDDGNDDSTATTVYAWRHETHRSQCLMLLLSIFDHTPLSQRAWTLQEQFLATRMAHFDPKEIFWQCDSAVFCECMEVDNFKWELSGRQRYLRSLASPSGHKYRIWYSIVDTIIERSITKPEDILPALSGLARKVQDSGGGRYLAGLWFDDLPQGLLWMRFYDASALRATPYRAPSWSWASVQVNAMVYEQGGGETDLDTALDPTWATVTKAVVTPKGADPLGAVVADGYLEVYAPVLEAVYLQSGILKLLSQSAAVPYYLWAS